MFLYFECTYTENIARNMFVNMIQIKYNKTIAQNVNIALSVIFVATIKYSTAIPTFYLGNIPKVWLISNLPRGWNCES